MLNRGATCASRCSKVGHSTTHCGFNATININRWSITKGMTSAAADTRWRYLLQISSHFLPKLTQGFISGSSRRGLNLVMLVIDLCYALLKACYTYQGQMSCRTLICSLPAVYITPITAQDEVAEFVGNRRWRHWYTCWSIACLRETWETREDQSTTQLPNEDDVFKSTEDINKRIVICSLAGCIDHVDEIYLRRSSQQYSVGPRE